MGAETREKGVTGGQAVVRTRPESRPCLSGRFGLRPLRFAVHAMPSCASRRTLPRLGGRCVPTPRSPPALSVTLPMKVNLSLTPPSSLPSSVPSVSPSPCCGPSSWTIHCSSSVCLPAYSLSPLTHLCRSLAPSHYRLRPHPLARSLAIACLMAFLQDSRFSLFFESSYNALLQPI